MTTTKLKTIAETNKDILHGTPVFKGTRVSIPLILEYLSKGWSITDLKQSYPEVQSTQIVTLLKLYSEELTQLNGHKKR